MAIELTISNLLTGFVSNRTHAVIIKEKLIFISNQLFENEQGGVAAPPTSLITERYKIEAGCSICQVKIRKRKNTKMMIKETTIPYYNSRCIIVAINL